MAIEVEESDTIKRKADGRGRVAIGPDKAGKKVKLAIVEVEEPDD
jgi:hypothetical protein